MTVTSIDITTAPLKGTTLVEASAGTGKTWTVAALYVRLVLERFLPVERVLVLTFGRGATAELKARIRSRLVETRDALAAPDTGSLSTGDVLLEHMAATTADPISDALRLTLAIESFDQAPVLTIHAFCQRVLAEHAFESGVPFATELAPDETTLIDEVAQDFWRREMTGAAPLWAHWLAQKCISPKGLAQDIAQFQQRPYAKVIGPEEPPAEILDTFVAAYQAARALWRGERAAILEQLAPVWPASWCESRAARLNAFFCAELAAPPPPDQLDYFSHLKLAGKRKKAPRHAFFEAATRLSEAASAAGDALPAKRAAMRVRLAAYARSELPRRKRERGVTGYGDLVVQLRDALRAPDGVRLAARLRERYPAALLDEFQDTDRDQTEIFARIYTGHERALYFVADPKQAIYGFRGADVTAYVAASAAADERRTLLVNRRAIEPQVRAVNAIFARPNAFLAPGIDFVASTPGPQEHAALLIAEESSAPFTIWFLERTGSTPIPKGVANERVAAATATAIASLLSPGRAQLDGVPLQGSDIAVLVPSHRQGRLVRTALAALDIASVTYGQENVFQSQEAPEVERVLLAVAQPAREGLVRAALATDLLGWTGERLAALASDARLWDEVLLRFAAYREQAIEHGFVRMWRLLIAEEGVVARVLAYRDGERRLTNLQHLSDLLEESALHEGLDLEGLARLLARAREARIGDSDAQLLRLESDERLVRILTVHVAKGREFPIVFCPFLWEGGIRAETNDLVASHAEDGAYLDTGSAQFADRRQAAAGEELSERLRLAYVALTRAKYRCTIAWGAVNEADTSPLAWLLHGALRQDFAKLSDVRLRADLAALVAQSEGAIGIETLPVAAGEVLAGAAPDAAPLTARSFDGSIRAPWRVSSFSAIAARREVELPDYDALAIASVPVESDEGRAQPFTLFSFPRGVQAGTLIHALLERLDFAAPEAEPARLLVEGTLASFGVDAAWAPVLRRMLADVVATPLDAERTLKLSQVAAERRIAELEFLFPMHAATGLLASSAAARAGFMKGYIDLVFEWQGRWYIVDWKSNWLGNDPADYAPAQLAAAMRAADYELQYRLYTVAVHRYLAARLEGYDYERHFGGVYYLFVRGMRPESGPASGVFFARPTRREIDESLLVPAFPTS